MKNRNILRAALLAISVSVMVTSCSKEDENSDSLDTPPVVVGPDDTPASKKTYTVTLPDGNTETVEEGSEYKIPRAPGGSDFLKAIYWIDGKQYKSGDIIVVNSDITITVERFGTLTMEQVAEALPNLETECTITITDYDGSSMSKYLGGEWKKVHLILQMKEGVTEIGDDAFKRCNSLVSIVVPEGVTSIGDGAFYECTNLVSAKLPESLTDIGRFPFWNCKKLSEVNIPSKLEALTVEFFLNCGNLEYVKIPDDVTVIAYSAFLGCEKLNRITIPDGVTTLGYSAFMDCESLASLKIPEGVEFVGWNAFENTAIKSLELPKSVKNIGDYKFENGHMIEITVPAGVESIAEEAFYHCQQLKKITIEGNPNIWGNFIFSDCDPSLVVYVTQQTYDKYHEKFPMMQVKK